MFSKLQDFRASLNASNGSSRKLYFVKVDIQAAFDSIPQRAVQKLVESLLSQDQYQIRRHTEIKPADSRSAQSAEAAFKPSRKFCAQAGADGELQNFVDAISARPAMMGRQQTVFVDTVVPDRQRRSYILELLNEHISANIVRIGKKFYRQKNGIPQGSILSSLLCNLFYADFEAKHLEFLNKPHNLLMRLIDDFLLITTERRQAVKFLTIMHGGSPAYGMTVRPEKSLVNFDVKVQDITVPKLEHSSLFAYCGMLINTKTLNVSKDHSAALKSGKC